MGTTTIRIPAELKARVASVAARAGTTPHHFILQAILEKAELEEQRVLVPEMVIDRRRGVLDLPGDGAHGHRLDAIANEQIACGIQYLGPNGVAGAGPALESAHGSSLTLLSNAGQGPRCRLG